MYIRGILVVPIILMLLYFNAEVMLSVLSLGIKVDHLMPSGDKRRVYISNFDFAYFKKVLYYVVIGKCTSQSRTQDDRKRVLIRKIRNT